MPKVSISGGGCGIRVPPSGGEIGVLEDMCVAVAELSTVKIQVRHSLGTS